MQKQTLTTLLSLVVLSISQSLFAMGKSPTTPPKKTQSHQAKYCKRKPRKRTYWTEKDSPNLEILVEPSQLPPTKVGGL